MSIADEQRLAVEIQLDHWRGRAIVAELKVVELENRLKDCDQRCLEQLEALHGERKRWLNSSNRADDFQPRA